MDAGQHDLPEAGRGDALDFDEDISERHTPWPPPGRRNDAIRTLLAAACLNSQRERSPAGHARLDRGAARSVTFAVTMRRGSIGQVGLLPQTADEFDDRGFIVVGEDPQHGRKFGDVLGTAGRIAARDQDFRRRVRPRDSANRLPGGLFGTRRHGAGVHDNQIRVPGVGGDVTLQAKALLHAERIGLVDATAESDHRVLHAILSSAFLPISRRYCMPSNEI